MLALLLTASLFLAPQDQAAGAVVDAVAVRGDTELSPAEAFASARRKAEQHVREQWQQRVEQTVIEARPFWLPDMVARDAMRRWLRDLPIAQLIRCVDREDREREHEFGSSYQTTLWVAEEPAGVQVHERQLRRELRMLERKTAVKYGGVVAGWVALALLVGWVDRLSRGYMTGRLRLVGLVCGVAFPALAFLV